MRLSKFNTRTGLLASAAIFSLLIVGCSGQVAVGQTNTQVEIASSVSYGQDLPDVDNWKYGLPGFSEKVTDGGKGGPIVRVTSLASDGPGTLREAIGRPGSKIIVFEVAGAIDLNGDNLLVDGSDITIAGQTAPSPGISVIRGGFVITGHDIIVQHLRIRPGDLGEAPMSGRDIDALTTIGASNVIVDHCSLSWATDENLSASSKRFMGETPDDWYQAASHHILYSRNIIAERLSHSTHAKGEHSKGSLIHDHVNNIVIYQNLYSSNFERSPLFKGDVHGSLVNNLIYNPGQRAVHYNLQAIEWEGHEARTGEMDLVSNVLKYGPSTQAGLPLLMLGGIGDLNVYDSDNIALDRWGNDAPKRGTYETGSAKIVDVISPLQALEGLRVLPSEEVENYVLKYSGARAWDRDHNDVRVLADAAEGRGAIINSQSEVGGYPVFESSRKTFDPSEWNLETMTPVTEEALDNGSKARGT